MIDMTVKKKKKALNVINQDIKRVEKTKQNSIDISNKSSVELFIP